MHFVELLPIEDTLERDFYSENCRLVRAHPDAITMFPRRVGISPVTLKAANRRRLYHDVPALP